MSKNPSKILLSAKHLSKNFSGLHALQDVSFDIPEHCIYGIIGPNGAGKTTLFNIITGLYQADAGELWFNGKNIINQEPHNIVKQGIARTFQNIRLFANMTALENVMVGRHTLSRAQAISAVLRTSSTRAEEQDIQQKSEQLLRYVGLNVPGKKESSNKLARELSYGDQRRLEIARALATEPKLLALDEPAAGMNPSETRQLQQLLERLRSDHVNVLLIEHDVKFVMNLCERVLVLDYGVRIAEDVSFAIQNNPLVIEAYLGVSA